MSVLVYMGSSPSLFNMMKNFYSCIRILFVGGWFLLSMCLLCQCKSKEATAVVNYSKGFDGIDVSHHNGVIDWKTVRKNNKNIQFVYVKATEGKNHVDKNYLTNAREAHKQKLKVGIYHYFTSRSSATEQFAWFRQNANKTWQDLVPVVDVEEFKGWRSKEQLQDSIMVFVRLVKKHYGKLPMIYTHQNFYNTYLYPRFNKHYLFIAAYRKTPPVIKGAVYDIWQYTDAGRVQGIKRNVDLSRLSAKMKIKQIILP